MLRTRRLTPQIYSKQSRDFQFIGRLYDMVLNSVKTNTDLIYSMPGSENADTAFLDLLAMTLGFKAVHNYNINQLKSLCSCLAKVIRNKGNAQSIEMACNALVGAEGLTDPVYVDYSNNKKEITLYVSADLSDINLLKDLLNYILPAGLSYNIIRQLRTDASAETTIAYESNVSSYAKQPTSTASVIISQLTDTTKTYAPNVLNTEGMMINALVTAQNETVSTAATETQETTENEQDQE